MHITNNLVKMPEFILLREIREITIKYFNFHRMQLVNYTNKLDIIITEYRRITRD